MSMKKNLAFFVCAFVLSGCVSERYIQWSSAKTPKDKLDYLLKAGADIPVKLDDGGLGLLSQIRQTYLAENMPYLESDSFVEGLTDDCFPKWSENDSSSVSCAYKYYSSAVDVIKKDNARKIAEKNFSMMEGGQCQSNSACVKKETIVHDSFGTGYKAIGHVDEKEKSSVIRYCEMSAGIVMWAYTNALTGRYSGRPVDADSLKLTPNQLMAINDYGANDVENLFIFRRDPAAFSSARYVYINRCRANPSQYIFNYEENIPHKKVNKKGKNPCVDRGRSPTVDELTACIKYQNNID